MVRRTILDPNADTVTHLVIQPRYHTDAGRLVPVSLVDVDADTNEITLRCTLAEFGRLDPAEETDLVGGIGPAMVPEEPSAFGWRGPASGLGMAADSPLVVSHSVPPGETEVERHEPVHAVDGRVGQVGGFLVDPLSHTVTHVLLKEGHLWGRKQVAIPVSVVASFTDGIKLTITKEQVGELPSAAFDDR
jgi:hypothetical protein